MMNNLREGTCCEHINKQAEERCFTNEWNDGNHWPAGDNRKSYTPTFALTDKGPKGAGHRHLTTFGSGKIAVRSGSR